MDEIITMVVDNGDDTYTVKVFTETTVVQALLKPKTSTSKERDPDQDCDTFLPGITNAEEAFAIAHREYTTTKEMLDEDCGKSERKVSDNERYEINRIKYLPGSDTLGPVIPPLNRHPTDDELEVMRRTGGKYGI